MTPGFFIAPEKMMLQKRHGLSTLWQEDTAGGANCGWRRLWAGKTGVVVGNSNKNKHLFAAAAWFAPIIAPDSC
jgi:hypothetical protein